MRKSLLLAATAISTMSVPAMAQDRDDGTIDSNVIIVTAQRQAQSAQDVPIAVSAFSGAALEAQQIENSSDLQLTLPNITFTKTNFVSSSFTIRGIGDLCVGASCDQATAIHLNDSPLFATRLFETEFFDLERVEVLRGASGVTWGSQAVGGVVNITTRRPTEGFTLFAQSEYGAHDTVRLVSNASGKVGPVGLSIGGGYVRTDGISAYSGGTELDGYCLLYTSPSPRDRG